MSERWGTCKACKGHGVTPIFLEEVFSGVLYRCLVAEEECGTCNGEGFSGSAEDAPSSLD